MTGPGRRHLLALLPLLPLSVVLGAAGEEALFTDPAGRALRLEDFRGRPLLVDIWASWCAPCVTALPMIERMAVEFRAQGLVVLSLSIDRGGAPAALRAYHRMGIALLPLYLGHPDRVTAAFAVNSLPTTLLFDAGGQEFARFAGGGAVPADRLRAATLDLLCGTRQKAKD